MRLRAPPEPLPAGHESLLEACAANWSGAAGFDLSLYETAAEAMDAYAAFHASSLRSSETRQSLVFVPNQYGLGNRLRAMKSTLLLAMLTGRVFHVRWEDPFPLAALVRPERIDWREPQDAPLTRAVAAQFKPRMPTAAHILCLPFATAPPNGDCARSHRDLQTADLRATYANVESLEVHTFTDLYIFLSKNPHYEALLARLEPSCPKRMGCLYKFLFSPQPIVERRLGALIAAAADAADWDATSSGAAGAMPGSAFIGVQVRNRLWKLDALKGGVASPGRMMSCLDRWVPPRVPVFFTADDDALYAPARQHWGARLLTDEGGKVYEPWSRGGKVDAATLGEDAEQSVIKAFVDWFALQSASRIVYTHQSSFGKTAAESTTAPNVDVNYTRCVLVEAGRRSWQSLWEEQSGSSMTYDTSKVPGAR